MLVPKGNRTQPSVLKVESLPTNKVCQKEKFGKKGLHKRKKCQGTNDNHLSKKYLVDYI